MDIKELIGITLGTCTLEQIIGRGGMGAVYLAQQARPVRTVAVKVLIPTNVYESDQQRIFLERFRREADTIAKLEHKNILPIYEYAEAVVDGQQLAYLVMPFIRGGTLRERMDEMKRSGGHFELQVVASYISQVADALSYAHGMGVVHRDIKPGNLLFHTDGRLLLGDFGIVRLKAMPALTSVGSFLGTAEYASPEQISTSNIDYRSDIYSLGIILYELLTGTVPFTGPNAFQIMASKMTDPVPSVRDSRSDLSPAIEAVVVKALAKNPADRYQNAAMMAADLQAAVASTATPLRLSGDGNNIDLTMAERPWGIHSPMSATAPSTLVAPTIPQAQPYAAGQQGQQAPGQWQLPSQMQTPLPTYPVGLHPPTFQDDEQDKLHPNSNAQAQDAITYRPGRRLFFYGTALMALLLQFLVFFLLTFKDVSGVVAMLGILVGSGINLLILAAISFTGVTRDRSIGKYIYRGLIVSLLAPILSGLFIGFGEAGKGTAAILAYVVLLLCNLFALRQLALTDKAKEQVEVAPVFWKATIGGALTGLLPLIIILLFALPTLLVPVRNVPPLLNLLGILLIVLIGIPTPGAVMAVWQTRRATIRFPSLVRSSALSGMLMSAGAFLFVAIFGLAFSSHSTASLSNIRQSWLALLIMMALLALMGALRGMLDAWIYQKIRRRDKRATSTPTTRS
ncbi:MAG: serine/threonine-protein kinase [Ktedonobacteraceae bacterium]